MQRLSQKQKMVVEWFMFLIYMLKSLNLNSLLSVIEPKKSLLDQHLMVMQCSFGPRTLLIQVEKVIMENILSSTCN